MAMDWGDVRYRGDSADVEDLFKTYRVGDYLDTFEENRRRHEQGIRERFLKDGIRLSERLSPRIYGIFRDVCTVLAFQSGVEVYCLPDATVNAYAVVDHRESGNLSLIGVTAGALEQLDDGELKSILGHELGHFLFGNNRLDALLNTDEDNPAATVLPALGESLFLRWQKKAEISADRVGLLACGDFKASARSLLKATFGLSERNLNLDVGALLLQIEELKDRPEMMEESFASHPLLPIRLKALELFSRSAKAKRAGFHVKGHPLSDATLEDAVDALVLLCRRYPFKPVPEAAMRIIALGGALIMGADHRVSDEEVKVLVSILHRFFTDEPEREIITNKKEILKRLPPALSVLKRKGDTEDRSFVLSRLADIAIADGALTEPESAVVLDLAKKMGVATNAVYSILVGAAQSTGLRADAKLNRITGTLRRTLQTGFKPKRARAFRPTKPKKR